MKLLNYIFKEPNMILAAIWARIGKNVKDSTYIKWRYQFIFKRKFHDDNPVTYNEKLNWLKIHYYNPLYTELVDKAEVKKYVSKRIGEDPVIPTYGVWDNFEDIDFSSLPDKFVIKSTNGGGGTGVFICKDKSKIDKVYVKHLLEESMKTNFRIGREWVYYDVKPRIIAEAFLENPGENGLVDYKIMCFNGEPRLLFYASDRYTKGESLKFDWYDMDLKHLPIKSRGIPSANKEIPYFPEFDTMKQYARALSQGIPQVRVDFYLIQGKVYFGEMTFFHDGGSVALEPEEWEYKVGAMIDLPERNR